MGGFFGLLTLFAGTALAHGGEDHTPAAAATAAPVDAPSVAMTSDVFDAVLRVPSGAPGAPVEATLLLADHATSAPVEGAAATLTLTGPGEVSATLGSAGAPGVYHGDLTLPAYGDYAGSLVVTGAATELFAVPGLHWDPPAAPEVATEVGGAGLAVGLGLVAAVVAGVLGVGIGYALGRVRGAAAGLAAVLVFGAARRVEAHGGEDHGAPAPAAVAGAALDLRLESQFLVGLRTASAVRARFQERVPAVGRFVARPGEAATLGAPVDGVLVAPPGGFPTPGQVVAAGDTLALVRESPSAGDRAALAQERAAAVTELAEARAALTLAERDVAAIPELGDAISERERAERAGALDVAQARATAAQAAVAALEGGVTVPIRAPVSGRLAAVAARPGDQVGAGKALFRVVDPAGLWVEVAVPERHAIGIVSGAEARVTAPATPGASYPAVVLDAGQEADPATGTVTVTLAVEGAPSVLPGMSATAWVGRGSVRDALVVPPAAVLDSEGMPLAFVKTGPERFEARELRVGARADGQVEVLGGLRPGERVVTAGTYPLRSMAGR